MRAWVGKGALLPDPRDQLAAHAGATRLVAGHDALRGGHDGGAHAALDLGDLGSVHVLAPARLRQALEPEEDAEEAARLEEARLKAEAEAAAYEELKEENPEAYEAHVREEEEGEEGDEDGGMPRPAPGSAPPEETQE